MKSESSVSNHRLTCGILLVVACLASACTVKSIGHAASPDGRWQVQVVYTSTIVMDIDGKVTIELIDRGVTQTIYPDPLESDRQPAFVEVAWTQDSRVFGMWEVDNLSSELLFAYDVFSKKEVPAEAIMGTLRESLVKRFRLEEKAKDPSFNVVEWTRKAVADGKIKSVWP